MQTIRQPNRSELASKDTTSMRRDATWADYLQWRVRDDVNKIAFHQRSSNQGWLWIDMGKEGPNHARFSDLLTIILGFWAFMHPEETFESFGRCLIENPEAHACAPDLLIYKEDRIPQWQAGEPRQINLSKHRIPDLVGEIADTSLSLDLDEQKHLYASLGIPEYWVIDVQGLRIFAFALDEAGEYQLCDESRVLEGLSIELIQQTLQQLETMTNTAAANWFMQQLQGE